MIYGIGIDIVHIPKFKQAIEKWGEKLENRLFTQNELAYCKKRRFPEQHLAARFAAKEAFFKALGRAVQFSAVEVANGQDGKPCLSLIKRSYDQPSAFSLNFKTHLTLSHDGDYCVAQAVLESTEPHP
ncbi:MAG: holo-ACP synthase [Deltaproteobacteria bacterium]|nr:holo-ACP synthase [Deltaproteobacteria bacterium]